MENTRFDSIMALVDAWAVEHAGYDCRDEAVAEVNWLLGIDRPEWASVSEMTDEEIAEEAVGAWLVAE